MKVFSLEKFKEHCKNSGDSEKLIQLWVKTWAMHCNGQTVHGDKVLGVNGVIYDCMNEWTEERLSV